MDGKATLFHVIQHASPEHPTSGNAQVEMRTSPNDYQGHARERKPRHGPVETPDQTAHPWQWRPIGTMRVSL